MGSDAVVLVAGAFIASAAIQAGLLRLATKRGWVAEPSRRGFHAKPVPTLGGLGFALPVLAWLGWLATQEPRLAGLALAVGGVGLIGLIDDLRELGWPPRLAVHCLAAALALWALAPSWSPVMLAAALALTVWHVNLFNFMDGIDGLAGCACLFFCLAVQFLSGGAPGWLGGLLWVTAGGALGFLTFNWPPARIFMGDLGSLFLGLLLAAITVGLIDQGILSPAACLILLAVLWFDTTYTLCVRIATRQRFTQAHRSHLYQLIVARRGQLWTTSAFLAFCILWLLPLAWLAQTQSAYGWFWLLVAALPLAVAAPLLRAGLPERRLPDGKQPKG
ncbi:MAG: hypothetical protein OXE83_11995 [Gammaproteobacteria bacterium]|nr:hypothetical protein [Gammaproteobacteria bacterium]